MSLLGVVSRGGDFHLHVLSADYLLVGERSRGEIDRGRMFFKPHRTNFSARSIARISSQFESQSIFPLNWSTACCTQTACSPSSAISRDRPNGHVSNGWYLTPIVTWRSL